MAPRPRSDAHPPSQCQWRFCPALPWGVWRLRLLRLRKAYYASWFGHLFRHQVFSFSRWSSRNCELSLNAMAFILSIHLRGSWMTFGDQKYATKMRPLTFDFGHLGSLVWSEWLQDWYCPSWYININIHLNILCRDSGGYIQGTCVCLKEC